jgi:hypothetical protein
MAWGQFFGCSGLSNTGCIEKNAALQCTADNLWGSVKSAHSTSLVVEVLVSDEDAPCGC